MQRWTKVALYSGAALLVFALWAVGAFLFALEAWGSRGMAKPWWMDLACAGTYLGWIVPVILLARALVLVASRERDPRKRTTLAEEAPTAEGRYIPRTER